MFSSASRSSGTNSAIPDNQASASFNGLSLLLRYTFTLGSELIYIHLIEIRKDTLLRVGYTCWTSMYLQASGAFFFLDCDASRLHAHTNPLAISTPAPYCCTNFNDHADGPSNDWLFLRFQWRPSWMLRRKSVVESARHAVGTGQGEILQMSASPGPS